MARADRVHLACDGEMRVLPTGEVDEKYVLTLTIDLRARTATVGSYAPVPMSSKSEGDTVVFQAEPDSTYGVSTGTLDRFTGAASIHIITLTHGLYMFHGTCRAAQKLF